MLLGAKVEANFDNSIAKKGYIGRVVATRYLVDIELSIVMVEFWSGSTWVMERDLKEVR